MFLAPVARGPHPSEGMARDTLTAVSASSKTPETAGTLHQERPTDGDTVVVRRASAPRAFHGNRNFESMRPLDTRGPVW